jgi:hypothetical protein
MKRSLARALASALLTRSSAKYVRPAALTLALFVLAVPPAQAASFSGTQTGPNQWSYTLTYHPLDNYAVCPAPGDVLKITLSGLLGVISANNPTSTDFPPGSDPNNADTVNRQQCNGDNITSRCWINPQVSEDGTSVTWTHLGPGTGNFGDVRHVFGFKVFTNGDAPPIANSTVHGNSTGISLDVGGTGPCPVQPADDRNFHVLVNGPGPLDSDGDGVPDFTAAGAPLDNCRFDPNPDQADRDLDRKGDACDACPLVADPLALPGDNSACIAQTQQSLVVEDGAKGVKQPILVTATFRNTSTLPIVTIRPDCTNTNFEVSFTPPGDIENPQPDPIRLNPIIRERAYGIPQDLVTIPGGASFTVTCDLAEQYYPSALWQTVAPRIYDVKAVYSNFVVDPDINPDGSCRSEQAQPPQACVRDIWIGSVQSPPASFTTEGKAETCPDQSSPTCPNQPALEALTVPIDIKPGSAVNSINLGSNGVVPVAILSTATFDARQVDPGSVTLAGAHVKVKGKGSYQASLEDVNGDGRKDLVVQVVTQALELTAGDTRAFLEAMTFDGQRIIGVDLIRVVSQ